MKTLIVHLQADVVHHSSAEGAFHQKQVAFLKTTYGTKISTISSTETAVSFVKARQSDPFDLVVIQNPKTTIDQLKELTASAEKLPIFMYSDEVLPPDFQNSEIVAVEKRGNSFESLFKKIEEWSSKNLVLLSNDDQNRIRIKTEVLLSVCPLKGDVFIRLNKEKFVKVFQQGDVFDRRDLENYTIKKGVEYLYVDKAQGEEFVQKLNDQFKDKENDKTPPLEDIIGFNNGVHEAVQGLVHQMGFTAKVQELTKQQVTMTVKAMEKSQGLAAFLDKLKESEGKYVSSHSTLCSYLACNIASMMTWGFGVNYTKLTLASFLHDIIFENEILASVENLDELRLHQKEFTAEEFKEYENHPQLAADMAKQMTEVPPDVDSIILQHHETPEATGFPRGIGHAYIAPLSCVFIVAHELAHNMIKNKLSKPTLGDLKNRYKSSQFKKIISAIESAGIF